MCYIFPWRHPRNVVFFRRAHTAVNLSVRTWWHLRVVFVRSNDILRVTVVVVSIKPCLALRVTNPYPNVPCVWSAWVRSLRIFLGAARSRNLWTRWWIPFPTGLHGTCRKIFIHVRSKRFCYRWCSENNISQFFLKNVKNLWLYRRKYKCFSLRRS